MLCVWKFQLPDWISCRIFVMWWQNIWARRASELVKCLLLIFASDVVVAAAVVRGRRLLCPTACIAPCFWSVYLCGRVCVAISWDLPPSVGWLNLSECYLFFLPSLSGRLFFFCFFFYYYCILIPEQHFSRVFATVPGWGGTKEVLEFSAPALTCAPRRQVGWNADFFSLQVKTWNLCNWARLCKKCRKWRKCTACFC